MPMPASESTSRTSRPASARARAQARPTTPAPTTMTSISSIRAFRIPAASLAQVRRSARVRQRSAAAPSARATVVQSPAWKPGSDPEPQLPDQYILTLSCPDRAGIVHAVTGSLLERGGNITEAAQYNDQSTGLFFMRVQFTSATGEPELQTAFEPVAARVRHELAAGRRRPQDADRGPGLQARPLPQRPAVSPSLGPAGARHQGHRLQPPRLLPARRELQHPVPPHPGDGRQQAAGRGPAAGRDRRRRRRAGHPGPLHAGAVGRPVPQARRAARSTSTIRSCPASRARDPTTRRTPAA